MIPTPWVAFVLALGVYRIARFLGWDDFPPIVRVRDWVTGARVITTGTHAARTGLSADVVTHDIEYRRVWLMQLLSCPYCIGFWISLATYIAWVFEPKWTLYIVAAPALSATVGIMTRWLDP